MQKNLWAVILAGGEGQRMRWLIESWLGVPRPKQYCTFVGTRSMLEHTLGRAKALVPSDQIITVVGDDQLNYLWEAFSREIPGRILRQPILRGTGAAVFLALTYILASDSKATVLVLPCDHFVYPEARFVEELGRLVRTAEVVSDRLVLLAARAERAEPDYGWIEPAPGDSEARPVLGFREKPALAEAREFMRRGFLWNTMVMAAGGKTLWRLGKSLLPKMMARFQILRTNLKSAYQGKAGNVERLARLPEIYAGLQPADFSADVLQRAPDRTVVLEMDCRIQWCDWGRPERVCESLRRIGKRPRFPAVLVRSGESVTVCES